MIKHWMVRFGYAIIGKEANKGLLFKIFIYIILFDTAYIYLRPMLYMITTMVKSSRDLVDPMVIWVPKTIDWYGFIQAWIGLDFPLALGKSLLISAFGAIAQVISCAIAGYAFARLQLPFKKFWFACLILAFIVPPQILALPDYLLFNNFRLIGTVWPVLIPTLFGQGIKGALFIIIYRQFFMTQSASLVEAARIDGANALQIFYKVMFPLAVPAIVVVFLFSFVWHWNDSFMQSLYLSGVSTSGHQVYPLSMGIDRINQFLLALHSDASGQEGEMSAIQDEPIKMAACFLAIVPLVVLYLYAQRWFVESIERTGIVE